tara:strand:- start:7207 stop:7542 length:336 start_codon:yes stop_codon:yes gene_type:complete
MKFNFLDWMNMNMFIDIAFLVFTAAFIWKFRKINKDVLSNQQRSQENEHKIAMHKAYSQKLSARIDLQSKVIVEMGENLNFIKEDLELAMKNPQEARRVLKRREKEDSIEQ